MAGEGSSGPPVQGQGEDIAPPKAGEADPFVHLVRREDVVVGDPDVAAQPVEIHGVELGEALQK